MKKNTRALGVAVTAVIVYLLVLVLAFTPLISTGGRRDDSIGEILGYVLTDSAKVDDREDLYDDAEDLSDYDELGMLSMVDVCKIYMGYSSSIYENAVPEFMYMFALIAFMLLGEILLVIVAAVYLLQTIWDMIRGRGEVSDFCRNLCVLTRFWAFEYLMVQLNKQAYELKYGGGHFIIIVVLLAAIAVCTMVSIVNNYKISRGRAISGQIVSVVLFVLALVGIFGMTMDAFRFEEEVTYRHVYSSEYSDYYDGDYENSSKSKDKETTSLAGLTAVTGRIVCGAAELEESYVEDSDIGGTGDEKEFISGMVNFGVHVLISFMLVIGILVFYTMSMKHFASGMCGERYSLAGQLLVSIISIVFSIALLLVLKNGFAGLEDAISDYYDAAKQVMDSGSLITMEFDISTRFGYILPFVLQVIFIIGTLLKAVLDKKLKAGQIPAANPVVNMGDYVQLQQAQVKAFNAYTQESMEGQQGAGQKICGCCGTINSADSAFCANCGQKLN